MNPIDPQFEQSLKERLDQSLDSIDDDSQTRLASMRLAALERTPSRHHDYRIPAVVALASIFTCTLIYVLLMEPILQEEQIYPDSNDYMSAVELIDYYEDPDLAEDIDLFLWLNDYPVSG